MPLNICGIQWESDHTIYLWPVHFNSNECFLEDRSVTPKCVTVLETQECWPETCLHPLMPSSVLDNDFSCEQRVIQHGSLPRDTHRLPLKCYTESSQRHQNLPLLYIHAPIYYSSTLWMHKLEYDELKFSSKFCSINTDNFLTFRTIEWLSRYHKP